MLFILVYLEIIVFEFIDENENYFFRQLTFRSLKQRQKEFIVFLLTRIQKDIKIQKYLLSFIQRLSEIIN